MRQDGDCSVSDEAVVLEYRLRLRDLYWFWETGPGGVIWAIFFVPLGILLLSTPLRSGDYPLAEDIGIGAAALLSAFIVGFTAGLTGDKSVPFTGRKLIRIIVDDRGVSGWPAPPETRQPWKALGRPRIERGMLILPVSWTAEAGHVPIPAHAFTPADFERVMAIARAHGWFVTGDGRTRWGSILAWIVDRVAGRPTVGGDGRMTAFPASHRPWTASGRAGAMLVVAGILGIVVASGLSGEVGLERSNGMSNLALAATLVGATALLAPWRPGRRRRSRLVTSVLLLALILLEVGIDLPRVLGPA
jgi:uncharacterized membrane protein YeaQ/YmgE (transglycosylase-associated protein family)